MNFAKGMFLGVVPSMLIGNILEAIYGSLFGTSFADDFFLFIVPILITVFLAVYLYKTHNQFFKGFIFGTVVYYPLAILVMILSIGDSTCSTFFFGLLSCA
jgi:hypothetical protein